MLLKFIFGVPPADGGLGIEAASSSAAAYART
jgi:hypothetical protein